MACKASVVQGMENWVLNEFKALVTVERGKSRGVVRGLLIGSRMKKKIWIGWRRQSGEL